MRAVRLHRPGGASELSLDEVPLPTPGRNEALVRVRAASITRNELEWPVDRLPAIPSYEVSGVVEAVGRDVNDLAVGDAVFALTAFDRDGVAAEYAAVPAELLAPKPLTLSDVESAALPMPGLTAWQGLFDHGALEAGQLVLIHGAAGGVGHIATQLPSERGAQVARTFDEALEPVDLVFDTVGGELLERSAAVVRSGGRLVSVAEEPPATLRMDITATYFVVELNRDLLIELARLADAGRLHVAIDSVFPLADATAAFERLHARGKTGKVVLQP